MVRPSGLVAVEFLLSRMARLICAVVKVFVSRSSGCCLRICLISLGVSGLGVWGTGRVNCLQKWVAIFCGLVWVVLWKDIGWLGSWLVRLPERLLKTFQYLREFRDREQESIRFSHSCCRFEFVLVWIVWFSREM